MNVTKNVTNNYWLVRSPSYTIPAVTESSRSVLQCFFKPDYSLQSYSTSEISHALGSEGINGVNLSIATSIADLFVNCIKISDIVIVTNKNSSDLVHIVQVCGEYVYDGVHMRAVKYLHSIPRTLLPKAFRDGVLRTPRLVAKIIFDEILQSILDKSVLNKPSALAVKFPLRPDFTIDFTIPSDLTKTEAERMSAFVITLFQKD